MEEAPIPRRSWNGIVVARIGAGHIAGSHFEVEVEIEVVVDIAEDRPCSSSAVGSREDSNSVAVVEVGRHFAVGYYVPCYLLTRR